MEWNFDDDGFKDVDKIHYDKLCPVCQQKLLEKKLAKIIEMNHYNKIQNDILTAEMIKAKLAKIKREKEEEIFLYLCKKHNKNKNTL